MTRIKTHTVGLWTGSVWLGIEEEQLHLFLNFCQLGKALSFARSADLKRQVLSFINDKMLKSLKIQILAVVECTCNPSTQAEAGG